MVNWGGDEPVRMQEWCGLMGDLVGVEPTYRTSDRAFRGGPIDAGRRTAVTGPTTVPWREGMTALVEEWLALRAQRARCRLTGDGPRSLVETGCHIRVVPRM